MLKRKLPLLFLLLVICLVLAFSGCTPPTHQLSTSVTPSDGGTVSPSGGPFQGKVTLVATPAKNYEFIGWAGAASGNTNPLTVAMNSDKQIVAQFSKKLVDLQLNQSPSNGGRVEPASGKYEAGSQVRITAIPASGFRFDRWTGSTSVSANPLSLMLDANKSLTASFVKIWNLSANCYPDGSGSIKPGSGTYDDGSKTTLSATAKFPYLFDHWDATDNANTNPTSITLTTDKAVTAYFTLETKGVQQIKTGIYSFQEVQIPVQLSAGQWLEVGISSSPYNIPVRILDPNANLLIDFGWTTAGSYTFQAGSTGTYTIDIKAGNSINSADYKVTYTPYLLPSPNSTTTSPTSITPTSIPTLMPDTTIQDSWTTSDVGDSTTWDTSQIRGQRWTPTSAYRMSGIEVFMRKVGQPGNVVLVVRAADGSGPTGPELAHITLAANDVPLANSWVRFNFSGVDLESGKTYCWGIYAESGSSPGNLYAIRYAANTGYSLGSMWNISSGTLQSFPEYEDLFKVYGQSYK